MLPECVRRGLAAGCAAWVLPQAYAQLALSCRWVPGPAGLSQGQHQHAGVSSKLTQASIFWLAATWLHIGASTAGHAGHAPRPCARQRTQGVQAGGSHFAGAFERLHGHLERLGGLLQGHSQQHERMILVSCVWPCLQASTCQGQCTICQQAPLLASICLCTRLSSTITCSVPAMNNEACHLLDCTARHAVSRH